MITHTLTLLVSAVITQPEIAWHTVAPGGTISNATYTLSSAIAQPAAGQISSGGFTLTGGFIVGTAPRTCGTSDFDGDGDFGTDADIEAFFACLSGNCCVTCYVGQSDFDADGDYGTDADIEAFFRVLGGGPC